ncbi:MAG: trypsin-like peptidase domain-containing protein, partial [Terrabacter sp.]
MSDDHQPDEHPQADEHPQPDERATEPQADEPTQPLAGWSPTPPQAPHPDGRAYGRPGPMIDGPPPQPQNQAQSQAQAQPHHEPRPDLPPATRPLGPGAPQGAWFGPGPSPYARSPYAQPVPTRRLPLWVWPAVACLALVVGVLGGLAGGALQDQLSSQRGTNDNGLRGVQTRSAAPLEADNGSVSAVAQALLPSTVQILAEFDGRAAGATGSGFVLDRDGHVVTNNHVVASAAEGDGPIVVIDEAGERHEATVVGRSAVYDLAVLSVDGAEALEPAALGASQVLRVGDPVVAFGAPLGLSQT